MMSAKSVCLASLLALAAGCVSTGEYFTKRGLERASFEMQCPKEQLQVKGLTADLDHEVKPGDQVGVTGCGKRLVYVLNPSGGWLLNSQSQ